MSNMTSRDDRRLAALATDPETELDEEALALLFILLLVASFLDEWRILDRPRSNMDDEPAERRAVLVLVVSLCVCRLLLRRARLPSTTASDMIMIEATVIEIPNTDRFMNRKRTEASGMYQKTEYCLGQAQPKYGTAAMIARMGCITTRLSLCTAYLDQQATACR